MIKNYIEKYEKNSIITSLLMIIIAIFLMIKPLKTIEWIIILFGVILLIDGVIDFINYFKSDKETKLYSFDLMEGLLEFLAGVFLLITEVINLIECIYILIKIKISFFKDEILFLYSYILRLLYY